MTDTQTIEPPATGTDIALIGSTVTAMTVFGAENGVDRILERITAQARAVDTDISTPAGRKAVASLAYKIARSKTALDAMGKDLGEQNYRAWKAITADRARIGRELDALAEDIRRPLTEFEDAEKARIAAHEAAIQAIHDLPGGDTVAALRARLALLEGDTIGSAGRDWQEFTRRAVDAVHAERDKTKMALAAAEVREAEAAATARRAAEEAEAATAREAERQRQRVIAAAEKARQEAEERARIAAEAEARRVEHERRTLASLAAQAAAKAKADAEALATLVERDRQAEAAARQEEFARFSRDWQEAKAEAAKAEAARLAAIADAEAHAYAAAIEAEAAKHAAVEQAAAAERQRITDAQERDAAETAAREANKRHRGKIHTEARDALVAEGLSEPAATLAVTAIARGAVPNLKVVY